MKPVKYPESIFCQECQNHVQMVGCRLLEPKGKNKPRVEFDYVCVSCGHRASAIRDWEYLQYSEREFCKKNGLADFGTEAKGQGVVYERVAPVKTELKTAETILAAKKAKNKLHSKKIRKATVKA